MEGNELTQLNSSVLDSLERLDPSDAVPEKDHLFRPELSNAVSEKDGLEKRLDPAFPEKDGLARLDPSDAVSEKDGLDRPELLTAVAVGEQDPLADFDFDF